MKKLFHVLCGVTVGLLAAPVSAQESTTDSGLYFSFALAGSDGTFVSADWTDSAVIDGLTEDRTWIIDYHYGGLAAVGYQWIEEESPAGFRLEVEGGYRRSYLEGYVDISDTYYAADGYLETGSVMGNAYVDFHLGESFSPYVGGGFGAARLARRDVDLVALGLPITNKFTYTTAYQVMAGVGYKLSPGTVLGLELRYMQLQPFSFPDEIFAEDINFKEILITFRLVG